MKTTITKIRIATIITLVGLITVAPGKTFSQTNPKITAAVLNIESKGIIASPESAGNMVNLEFEKIKVYNLLDRFDVADILKRNNINIDSCFGKICAIRAAKVLNVDKIIIGNIERFGEKIAITLKVIDSNSGEVEKSNTTEYLNLQKEIQKMIEISVKKLEARKVEQNQEDVLVAFDRPVESQMSKMNNSGPRVGVCYTDGLAGVLFRMDKRMGGFGMSTLTSMIGWQSEVQYLSAGNYSALIEFITSVTGLESGNFIPSISMLNGFRIGRESWEFAVGPTMRIISMSGGRPDSYGDPNLSFGLVVGGGRTFKSGYLNIPVNVYIVPRKTGTLYGLSFGFNIYKKG